MSRSTRHALVLTAAVTLLASACGSEDAPSSQPSAASEADNSTASFNDADVVFAQSMIPHHEQSAEAVDQWIRSRRTWRPEDMDPGREVPQALLDAMFENANWAPTHGLTEPWRFRLYRGAARAGLASGLQQLYADHTPPGEFRPDKHAKLGSTPLLAPVIIVICMHRQPGGKIPEIEEVAAVACAVQNMHLTARAAGLGAFWSSPPVLDTPLAKSFFGLREADRCLGLFYVGWLKRGERWPTSVRGAISEKVEWV